VTLEEAIEIKEDMIYNRRLHRPEKVEAADKLGIEALKWVHKERPDLYGKYPPLLPGETEE